MKVTIAGPFYLKVRANAFEAEKRRDIFANIYSGVKFMKIALIGLILNLLFVTSAVAERREFKQFSVEIPPAWSAEENDDGVYISANDGSAVFSIMIGELESGSSLEKAAEELTERYQGFGPKKLGQGEAYTFTYNDPTTDQTVVSLLAATGRSYIYISQIGENVDADAVISSIRPKD